MCTSITTCEMKVGAVGIVYTEELNISAPLDPDDEHDGPFAALAAMPCIATPGVWLLLVSTRFSCLADYYFEKPFVRSSSSSSLLDNRNGRPSCTVRCRITSVIGLYSGESG
eukprot:jgi/Picre1/33235/NNA_008560.t1